MIVIRTRLGDDVNDAGTRTAYLGRELVCSNLELSHAILRKVHQRAADNLVIIVATIYCDVAATTESTR